MSLLLASAGIANTQEAAASLEVIELLTPTPWEESGALTASEEFTTAASFTSAHATTFDLFGFVFFEYSGSPANQFAMDFGATEQGSTVTSRSFSGIGVWAHAGPITATTSGELAVTFFNNPTDNAAFGALTSADLEYDSNATATSTGASISLDLNIPEGGGAVLAVVVDDPPGTGITFTGVDLVATQALAGGATAYLAARAGLSADASYTVALNRTGSGRMNAVALGLSPRA